MVNSARMGAYIVSIGILFTAFFTILSSNLQSFVEMSLEAQGYSNALIIYPTLVEFSIPTMFGIFWCILAMEGLTRVGVSNKKIGVILPLVSGIMVILGTFMPILTADLTFDYAVGGSFSNYKSLTIVDGITFFMSPSFGWCGGPFMLLGSIFMILSKKPWSLTTFYVNVTVETAVERAVKWLQDGRLVIQDIDDLPASAGKVINFTAPIGPFGKIVKTTMQISETPDGVQISFKPIQPFGALSHASARKTILGI
jgi:hypothetical protein